MATSLRLDEHALALDDRGLHVALDFDLCSICAGRERARGDDGADARLALAERLILVAEVARMVVADRQAEDALGGLADRCFGRDAHLADHRAERVGDVGVRWHDAVVADQRRQAGVMKRGRRAEPDDRPVERDRDSRAMP